MYARCVFTASLGQIGAAATRTAHQFGQFLDDFTGVELGVEVFGNCCNERDFAVFGGGQDHGSRADFLAQDVDQLAQRFAVETVDFGGNQANPLYGFRLFDQIGGDGTGCFAFGGFELLFELFGVFELALDARRGLRLQPAFNIASDAIAEWKSLSDIR